MRNNQCDLTFRCPVEACLEVIGGKWKTVILFHLLGGTKRFNELRRLLPNVTQRMLTRQLRELEEDKLIERVVYPQVPPKVEYSLSDFGRTVEPILRMLHTWGLEYLDQINAMKHAGTREGAQSDAERQPA